MRVLIAGDSLGLPRPYRIGAYSPSEQELALYYSETYPVLVEERLRAEGAGEVIQVINKCVRAQTIKGVYVESYDWLYYHQPDVFVLQVGIVDLWFRSELGGGQKVPLPEYKGVLLKLIKERLVHMPNCILLLCAVAGVSAAVEERFPGLAAQVAAYNHVLESAATGTNVLFLNFGCNKSRDWGERLFLPDGYHLNKEGSKMLADSIVNAIEPVLRTGYIREAGSGALHG